MANGKQGQIETVPIDRDKFIKAMEKRGTNAAELSKEMKRSDSYFTKAMKNGRVDALAMMALENYPNAKYRIPYDEVKSEEKTTQEPEPETTPAPQNTDDYQFTQPSKSVYLNVKNPEEPIEVLRRGEVIELARTSALDLLAAILYPISEEPPRETIIANQIKRLVKAAFIEALEEDDNRGKYND